MKERTKEEEEVCITFIHVVNRNFADFKTGQSDIRVGGFNLKGVLTRQRQPKLVARYLKSRYEALG
jgi:beta-glucuronidase